MFENIIELIEENKLFEARKYIIELNEVDIEQLLGEIPQDKMLRIFRMLPKETAAEVFAEMDSDRQQYIIESITDREINSIMDELYMDDTVDFIEEMPANVVKKVLRNTDEATRKIINQLLKYPDDCAGSIMTTEFVDLKKEMTARDALEHIRKTGMDKETIDTCYVISAQRKLEGEISIRKLILSEPDTLMCDLMETVKSVQTLTDKEETAYLFRKYNLISMPVVDNENRLVGIITVDDVIDVIEQENTEDFHKMAAIAPSEKEYLDTGVISLAKNRIVWLLVLMISATFTGMIIRYFEATLSQVVALTAYMPMLMGTGGNAGAQSSTMIIRSLSLNELEFKDIFKVMWKELRVGILTAFMLAVVNFARIMIFDEVGVLVAFTVCASLFCIVTFAKVVGGMLPIAAKQIHLDPVIMASPIITTILDAVSLFVYFSFATTFLGIA
ncbi:MAG: magnesium transporter [Clostridia bacterium]|nr:magnesium transporter [Clostridia bacterium]